MPQQAGTWSFADVTCTITGPGGTFSLGAGSGNSEEGISVEYAGDQTDITMGADGTGMFNFFVRRNGLVHVRLLKTSIVNAQLSQMFEQQYAAGSSQWGQNVLRAQNKVTGDQATAEGVAFQKKPNNTFASSGGINDWPLIAIYIDSNFGGIGLIQF